MKSIHIIQILAKLRLLCGNLTGLYINPLDTRASSLFDMECKSMCWWIGFSAFIQIMMTTPNGNIFRVTGHLCGEVTGPGEFPTQSPVTRNFDVFFDLRQKKLLSTQSRGWWFETPSRPSWRHRNDFNKSYRTNSGFTEQIHNIGWKIFLPHQEAVKCTSNPQW